MALAWFATTSIQLEGQLARLDAAESVAIDGLAVRVLHQGLAQRQVGAPLVVFEAGATNSLDVWTGVLEKLAPGTAFVAYDRAGLGQSDWDGATPTPQHVVSRLHQLLDRIGARPPYVLVGYSWGGVLSRYFATSYPEEIAGIVWVDPGPIVTQSLAEQIAPFDSVGAGRAGYDAFWKGYGALFQGAQPAVRAEFEVFHGLMERDPSERDLRSVPDVPVVVLVSGKYLAPPPGMSLPYDPVAHHDVDVRHRMTVLWRWAQQSSQGTLVVSHDLTHAIPREDPGLIVWAIERVLAAAGAS